MYFTRIDYARARIAREHGVLIVGQYDALKFMPPPNTYLIRIQGWNPSGIFDFEPLAHKQEFKNILELSFDDVDNSEKGRKVFGKEEASKILDFFEKFKEDDNIEKLLMIHCQGGISRSTAVGCAYAHWVGNDKLETDIRKSPFAIPNSLVYRLLVNAMTYS